MPNPDGSAYEGSTYPEVPFHPRFTDPGVTFVRGGNPNIFGHALFRLGSNVGYIHVHTILDYPSLIPAQRFDEYLKDNGKSVIYKVALPLPKPLDAMEKIHHLRRHKWFWAVIPHNCVAFCEEILQAGACDWEQVSNLPMIIAASGEPSPPAKRPLPCDVTITQYRMLRNPATSRGGRPPDESLYASHDRELLKGNPLPLRKGQQVEIRARGIPLGGSFSFAPRVGEERDGIKTVQQGYDECIVMATKDSGTAAVTVHYRTGGQEDVDSLEISLQP